MIYNFITCSLCLTVFIYESNDTIDINIYTRYSIIMFLIIYFIYSILCCLECIRTEKVNIIEISFTFNEVVFDENIYNDKDCTICLEEFKKCDEIHEYKCKHIFHKKCSSTLQETHSKCPLCRSEL